MPGRENGGPCGADWTFCGGGPDSDEGGRWADWWGDACAPCAESPGSAGRLWPCWVAVLAE